jgi:hypothetical protein
VRQQFGNAAESSRNCPVTALETSPNFGKRRIWLRDYGKNLESKITGALKIDF